jgi:hypothetical protein
MGFQKNRNNRHRRTQGAHTLAEFGPTLLIAFCMLILPLLAFGMIGVRFLFVLNAARLSVQQAARCKTFLVDTSPTDRSAVNTATTVAQNSINGIGAGLVTLTQTDVYIKVCPLGAGPASVTTPGRNTPLPAAADATANTYNCECILQTVVQPLFPGARSILGGITGFDKPIIANVRMDCFFENETNLNQ